MSLGTQTKTIRAILFFLFFVSGFCALLYQTVWLRLAFASFGIITPVISIIISVFMLGLSLGSWLSGKYIDQISAKTKISPIIFYALAELLTAFSAPLVPIFFVGSASALLHTGSLDSISYLGSSACLIALSILPWCICMGSTFPLAMAFVKRVNKNEEKGFSFLYLGNVIGSAFGSLLTAGVLIELLGFRNTLWLAAGANITIALISFIVGLKYKETTFDALEKTPAVESLKPSETNSDSSSSSDSSSEGSSSADSSAKSGLQTGGDLAVNSKWLLHIILFTTGFASMAMEVVWVRAFLPVLGHAVYAFAALVFVYLWATALGAYFYRVEVKYAKVRSLTLTLALLAVSSFFPVIFGDPRLHDLLGATTSPSVRGATSLLSIAPFCAILGYLTPKVIDVYSSGVPSRAGFAYALNIIGCILGPLLAGYVLLPAIGAKAALIILALPFVALSFANEGKTHGSSSSSPWRLASRLTAVILLVGSFFCVSYEEGFDKGNCVVRRDHVATVLQTGSGIDKHLYVNGVQMTALNPVTKEVAHIPLLIHSGPVKKCLGICFGMGTSYRSQMSYGVDTTWVELVPSVKEAFTYFFDDAESLANSPHGRIYVDDGRRFLQRTDEKFDVISVDAPPPPESTGVGLLFSDEFYKLAKTRLNPNGIVEVLVPVGEADRVEAEVRPLVEAFPYVRVFLAKDIAYMCCGSMSPMSNVSIEEAIARMPERARKDIIEWREDKESPDALKNYLTDIFAREVDPKSLLKSGNENLRITDDRPFNEYFLVRMILRGHTER
jgi:spermidine synthase